MNKVALVIPAHNEEQNINEVLTASRGHTDFVIVVDDGSTDQTHETILSGGHDIVLLRHRINLGKGAALKTGFKAAQMLGADFIVTIDADGQHPPEHIPNVINLLVSNNLDVVFTTRQGGDTMPLVRRAGNRTLNLLARGLFNIQLEDMWCGFRAVRSSCLHKIDWRETDYSGEVEMALKVGLNKLPYGEYVIPTIYKDEFKGVTIIHGIKLMFQMVIWRIKLLL